jgi:hypothetical protein
MHHPINQHPLHPTPTPATTLGVTTKDCTPAAPTFDCMHTPLHIHNHSPQILKLWEELGAFEQSLKLSEGRKEFTFYDGPPFATGLPHYGEGGREEGRRTGAWLVGFWVGRWRGWVMDQGVG